MDEELTEFLLISSSKGNSDEATIENTKRQFIFHINYVQ